MYFYNINNKKEKISFSEATKKGIGKKQGLFFPEKIIPFTKKKILKLLNTDLINRSTYILSKFIEHEISYNTLKKIVSNSFSYPIKIKNIINNISIAELFHGPTLSFKDFGAKFLSGILSEIGKNQKIYIITATSGDTGAAVAQAFYKIKNIKVIILYSKNIISSLQEKMFCTLGKNIICINIPKNFDICQNLVKQIFNDKEINTKMLINSANSINISRLLSQICYFFEIFAKIPKKFYNKVVISIPCGNFGNLTAGLFAKKLGLPIKKFIIATNINNTVPRYLKNKIWKPNKTIQTISNAMDISEPNNWVRIQELFSVNQWNLSSLEYDFVTNQQTIQSIKQIQSFGYISEPHAAIAYYVLQKKIQKNEFGIFLGTAHPAKFQNLIKKITKKTIKLPKEILKTINLPILSINMSEKFSTLKKFFLTLV